MVSISCASTIKQSWGDSYPGGVWRGGIIEYVREDSSSARQVQKNKAIRDARKVCGEGRDPSVCSLEPVLRMDAKVSFFLGSYSEQVWYQPYGFVCPDSDSMTDIFTVVFEGHARCRPVKGPFRPGRVRHKEILAAYSSNSCETQEWTRYPGRSGAQNYFLGHEGLALCERLALAAVNEKIDHNKLDQWLFERFLEHRRRAVEQPTLEN